MVKDRLKHTILSSIKLSKEQMVTVLSFFQPLTLKKNESFIEVGKKCNSVAFISSGILRIFYPNDLGEYTTCHFAQEGEWATSLSVFGTNLPSKENIQALTDCKLLIIEAQDLEKMHHQVPAMQAFSRKVIEGINTMMEKRIAFFQNYAAEERYQYMLKNHPALLLQVPMRYLASYIGVTPQHLSRLRKMK